MFKRKIRKLTPAIIKNIIKEEREKILKESKQKYRKNTVKIKNKKNQALLENIEKRQKILVNKFKKLFLLKKRIEENK